MKRTCNRVVASAIAIRYDSVCQRCNISVDTTCNGGVVNSNGGVHY